MIKGTELMYFTEEEEVLWIRSNYYIYTISIISIFKEIN